MANLASTLKAEITRLARKELRAETEQLKKASTGYRTEIAALKREVASLREELAQATRTSRANPADVAVPVDDKQVRWSPAKLKRHRERLGLSAERFAKLFAVSAQTIYNWEAGTRPGHEHLLAISQLRKLAPRQAAAIVDARR